jgi:XRE family transcriptional regulator, fatty acid utilization regulator
MPPAEHAAAADGAGGHSISSRIDLAGNIIKRHSATRLQFARFGGACPLWNVHEAFGHPGRILVQIAEMPDALRYLCVARGIAKRSGSYLDPDRQYAVGARPRSAACLRGRLCQRPGPQGTCHADLGITCRICEHDNCPQRAFPPIDRPLTAPPNERAIVPYVLKA